jgi:hypothetical protein
VERRKVLVKGEVDKRKKQRKTDRQKEKQTEGKKERKKQTKISVTYPHSPPTSQSAH